MLYLGAYNVVNGTEDGNVQAFQIALSSINTHPDWFFGELENNIALIKLPTNPTLNGKLALRVILVYGFLIYVHYGRLCYTGSFTFFR